MTRLNLALIDALTTTCTCGKKRGLCVFGSAQARRAAVIAGWFWS